MAKIAQGTVDELTFDDQNLNKGTEEGAKLRKKSVKKFKMGRGIVTDAKGKIIGGNHITKEFIDNGGKKVIFVDTKGDELVVTRRMDIDSSTPEGLKKAQEMALADNATQSVNFDLDYDLAESLDLNLGAWGMKFDIAKPKPMKKEQQAADDYKGNYPLSIILSARDYKEWQEYKKAIKVKTDTEAFLFMKKNNQDE